MKNLDLSIVIVSYNTRQLTVDCVQSIKKTVKKPSYEIIVVDNASPDDSVAELQKLTKTIPELKVVANKDNSGFSKANNIGVKKSQGRYVLFLNSDTVVYDNTLDGMLDFMDRHPQAGASTCFLRIPTGELDDAAHRGFPTPWRALTKFSGLSKIFPNSKIFAGYNMTYLSLDNTHEVEALAGAFMLVRREAGDAAGWWDEDYFFYGEDIDFCYTLAEHGWKIYFVPEFEILHYKGASGGIKKASEKITTATRETRKKVTDARFAAMRIFYDKHYKKRYPAILRNLVLLGISVKKFFAERSL